MIGGAGNIKPSGKTRVTLPDKPEENNERGKNGKQCL
jgi:hypothetical protein